MIWPNISTFLCVFYYDALIELAADANAPAAKTLLSKYSYTKNSSSANTSTACGT